MVGLNCKGPHTLSASDESPATEARGEGRTSINELLDCVSQIIALRLYFTSSSAYSPDLGGQRGIGGA